MNFFDKRFLILAVAALGLYGAYKTLTYLKWGLILAIVGFVFYKAKNMVDFRHRLFQLVEFLPLPQGIHTLVRMSKSVFDSPTSPTSLTSPSSPSSPSSHKYTRKHHKRRVSGHQKKYVASRQKWKCNSCNELLDYSYEVDHIIPLYQGGNNHIKNLQALCRNCHGKKTVGNLVGD